jgi:shikimate dehydrogenase
MLSNKTRLFLSASASPSNFGVTVYNALFAAFSVDAVYLPRPVTDAAALVSAIRTLKISGCSVSMPMKTGVIPFLDGLDQVAQETNSVNTIVAQENGTLGGYNTDCFGIERCLAGMRLGNVLVYGAGSVTSSIVTVLKSLGASQIRIAARRLEQARETAYRLGIEAVSCALAASSRFDLIINATPGSKNREDSPELFELLGSCEQAFDLVISPSDTPWVSLARNRGIDVIRGVEMGIHQFQRQFQLYTGIFPPLARIEEIVGRYYLTNT